MTRRCTAALVVALLAAIALGGGCGRKAASTGPAAAVSASEDNPDKDRGDKDRGDKDRTEGRAERAAEAKPPTESEAATPPPRAGGSAPPGQAPKGHTWTLRGEGVELWLRADHLIPGRLATLDAAWTDLRTGRALDAGSVSVTPQCDGRPGAPIRVAERAPGQFRWRWPPPRARACTLVLRAFAGGATAEVRAPLAPGAPPKSPGPGFTLAKTDQWAAELRSAGVETRLLRRALRTEALIEAAAGTRQVITAPAAGRVARAPAGTWPAANTQVARGTPLLSLALKTPRPLRGLPMWWWPPGKERRDGDAARAALTLSSPVLGSIHRVSVHPGKAVAAGERLIEVIDETRVRLSLQLGSAELAALGPRLQLLLLPERGATVVVPMAGARPAPGQPGTQLIPFASPRRRWRVGQRVPAAVEHGEGWRGVAVPAAAVLAAGDERYVFVQQSATRFSRRVVQLGVWSGDAWEVKRGLRPGERVVVHGIDAVREALVASRSGP